MASGERRETGWTGTVAAIVILFTGLTIGGASAGQSPHRNPRPTPLASGSGAVSDSPSTYAHALVAGVGNPPDDTPEPSEVLSYCTRTKLDESSPCMASLLGAIDAARAAEGVGPMQIDPTAFAALSVAEQMFVVANLERIDRGLAPLIGMTSQLDADALAGAEARGDPQFNFTALTGGIPLRSGASNWAGGFANALEADYFWMYDDGFGSPNVDCPNAGAPGCWGHRADVLYTPAKCAGEPSVNVMGGAFSDSGESSYAEIFASACGPAPSDLVFTWSQARALLGIGTPTPPPATAEPASVISGEPPVTNGQVLSPHLHAREVVRRHHRERSVLLVVNVARSRVGRSVTVETRAGRTWTALTELHTTASGHARLRLRYAARRAPRLRVLVTPSGRYRGEVRRARLKFVVRRDR